MPGQALTVYVAVALLVLVLEATLFWGPWQAVGVLGLAVIFSLWGVWLSGGFSGEAMK